MKTNNEIAEEFAKGATSGHSLNIFIEGNTIYSYGYHFPVARRIEEGKIALFTTRKYSITTSKHKSLICSWLMGENWAIVEVDNVDGYSQANIDDLDKRIAEAKQKAKKARKEHTRNYWQDEAKRLTETKKLYSILVKNNKL